MKEKKKEGLDDEKFESETLAQLLSGKKVFPWSIKWNRLRIYIPVLGFSYFWSMEIIKIFLSAILLFTSFLAYPQNYVSTYAGNGLQGFVNGTLYDARFRQPFGMCIDKNDNLFIADGGNNCIRKVNTVTGLVSTLAGTGVAGAKDGMRDSAQFYSPSNVCVDDSGNVFVSDFSNHRIRKISFTGVVSTIAGSGIEGYVDGPAGSAQFDYPRGICVDTAGNVYVSDSWNHRIRKISKSGMVSTYAGGGTSMGVGSIGDLKDGLDTAARFHTPSGLAIDHTGNIYVADAYNHRIRKISIDRIVSGVCGTGATGNGNGGFANGDSSVALLNTPTELFVNTLSNELLIGETFGNRIRKVNLSDYSVSTFAGSGVQDYFDDVDSLAAFRYPRGVVADNSGNKVYVCDYNNHAIRLIEPMVPSVIIDEAEKTFSVYPNPSSGIFRLSGLPTDVKRIRLYSITGLLVKEANNDSSENIELDLSTFPSGVYYCKAKTISGEWSKRIVKQ
ncbi:MAG: T9SS type A sorting domain-containing protein [Bacteroidetes bacterium]|nr:T9SS type A sorting domain-containing protein [Bacteroidota bacterium]